MTAFYLTENTSRAVEVDGKKFTFEPAEYFTPTMSWWGTLAVEDPADIEKLDAAVAAKKIHRITEADYQKYEVKKKKPRTSPNLIALKDWHAPQMGNERKAAAPAEVASREIELETVADALSAKPATKAKK